MVWRCISSASTLVERRYIQLIRIMSWNTYHSSLLRYPQFGFSLDLSLMDIGAEFYSRT